MKLILAIINKEDSQEVSHALTKEKYSVTKLATQGGFLMSGNVTLIIGTEDEKVTVKIGDRIMYDKYAGTEIKIDDEEHLILRMSDIIAIIEK